MIGEVWNNQTRGDTTEMTDLIPIFFYVMFAVAIVIIAVTGVKGFRQRRANDARAGARRWLPR